MGLGLNAAHDTAFTNYELTPITQIQLAAPDANRETVASYKSEFGLWIIACGLRETIETFVVFLDEIHKICKQMAMIREKITVENPEALDKKFTFKGIDKKLFHLKSKFRIESASANYLVGINKVRNCLTHRRGIVGAEDCMEGDELIVKWMGLDIQIVTPSGEVINTLPMLKEGFALPKGGNIIIKNSERVRFFKKGASIELSPKDLAEVCYLTLRATDEIVLSAVNYAESIGVKKVN